MGVIKMEGKEEEEQEAFVIQQEFIQLTLVEKFYHHSLFLIVLLKIIVTFKFKLPGVMVYLRFVIYLFLLSINSLLNTCNIHLLFFLIKQRLQVGMDWRKKQQ